MHPEFAPIAILSALSLLLPLPWHWRSGNVATLSIIGWLFVTNIIYAVDAIIWSNNVNIVATLWCDISTKLIIGANFALPATCLCICIHLEQISSSRHSSFTIADKRRRQVFEASMCIGLPIVFMALHYVVQGHRFDIIEAYGCRPTTYFSIPSIFIIWIPPILMSVAAIVYAGFALRHFIIRRLSFAAHLQASNSALTTSRYIRLMTMAAIQMVWSIAATSYSLWFTVMSVPIRPWTTWADVHSDWLRIDQYPYSLIPIVVKKSFNVIWWIVPSSTFIFVAFFAFGQDAMDEYTRCLRWIYGKFFRQPLHAKGFKITLPSIPMSPTHLGAESESAEAIAISPTKSNFSNVTLPSYNSFYSCYNPPQKFPSSPDFYSESEATRYSRSPHISGKAIGSFTDLSVHTRSTVVQETPKRHSLPSPTLDNLPPPLSRSASFESDSSRPASIVFPAYHQPLTYPNRGPSLP